MGKDGDRFFPKFKEVTRHNLDLAVKEIKGVIQNATFIAIDTEFTGLGSSQKVNAKNLDERYAGLQEVARTRSLVSFGVCAFTQMQESPDKYNVCCYDFLTLSYGESLVVEPTSLEFLVNSGFSLDKLVKDGCPYILNHQASAQQTSTNTSQLLRSVFESIIKARKPVVVHNGLLDLMLLYQNFYNELPGSMDEFLCDLSEMYEGGVYDTKEIAEYESREKATYLKYLFRKYEREQVKRKANSQPHVTCLDDSPELEAVSPNPPPLPRHPKKRGNAGRVHPDTGKPYCEQYALHGHCPESQSTCKKSHELDFILDCEEEGTTGSVEPPVKRVRPYPEPIHIYQPSDPTFSIHSACYDAFMTGFVFAAQRLSTEYENHKNKIYLMNKSIPLIVKKSIYSATSKAHNKSMARIFKKVPCKVVEK